MNQANLSEAVVAAGSGVSAVSSAPVVIGAGGIDSLLNDTLAPFASWLSEMVFYEVSIGGVEFPLIVA